MWKPIDTAPKDGSFVLICDTEDPSELMIIARWRFGAGATAHIGGLEKITTGHRLLTPEITGGQHAMA